MTEKEKMLNGDFYDSRDVELLTMYHRARKLLQMYNQLESTLTAERARLLNELLGYAGPGVWIEAPFFCDYGENISIGKNTFVNTNCMFLDNNKIDIGADGLIAPYVQIYTAIHPLRADQRIVSTDSGTRYKTSAQPVTIGDRVWIGGNVVICPGVTIGDNVTIGAGSVVRHSIPDNVLAAGNPCEILRNLI